MIDVDGFELWRERDDDKPLIIRGEARVPEKPVGTVVVCHGFKGFAHFSFFPYVATELANARFRAITFDFSGSGVGEDRENFTNPDAFTHNTYTQELDDIESVVAEARVRGWMKTEYGLLGHSRGGTVAILRASRDPNVGALVTWAAMSSTHRWTPDVVASWRQSGSIDVVNARTKQTIPLSTGLLDEVEELGDTTLNVEKAAAQIRAPWLILHGAQDETVPVDEGERLSAVAGSRSMLRVIENTNHSFGGKHPLEEVTPTLAQVTRETVEFFVKHMAAPAA